MPLNVSFPTNPISCQSVIWMSFNVLHCHSMFFILNIVIGGSFIYYSYGLAFL
jgi:hypothetical protein